MGIISNLVFPPPDIPVVDVMDRIGKSGCLYTVLVNPQNEYHRSCTLNILHGTPQGEGSVLKCAVQMVR